MNKKFVFAAILLLVSTAQAGEPVSAPFARTALRQGWFTAPMVTYMKPDKSRCGVDPGVGGALAGGYRSDFGAIELWGQFLQLSHDDCTYQVPGQSSPLPIGGGPTSVTEPSGTLSLHGGGVDLLVGPYYDEWYARFFGILGFGVLQRQGHPQFPEDKATLFADAGAGYMVPFELFGLELALRAEGRYRFDVQPQPQPETVPPVKQVFRDVVVNVGLVVPLSSRPEPPPPPPPVQVVEVAPVADADGDGVVDGADQCPDTPAGTTVNEVGCVPEPPPPPPPATLETAKAGDTFILHGVNFETARATLTANAKTILDGVAATLAGRAELKVEVGGHTDSRGSDAYNQELSERRAQSVMDYLIEHGVAADRLTAVGYGEGQPVDSNDTDEGQEHNRRVELKVLESTTP